MYQQDKYLYLQYFLSTPLGSLATYYKGIALLRTSDGVFSRMHLNTGTKFL